MKLKCNYQNKKTETSVHLKSDLESYFYLENEIVFKSEKYTQFCILNSNEEIVKIHSIDDQFFDPPRELQNTEELSLILPNKEEYEVEYEFVGIQFKSQTIHNSLSFLDRHVIKKHARVKTRFSIIERFVFNKDMTVKNFEIKNRKEVQIYEQNQFIFVFKFNTQSLGNDKLIFMELNWDETKYCIIGKTKYCLTPSDKIKTKEITFVPYDSGFLEYPRILLIEQKQGQNDITHLINKPTSKKLFFVKEGVSRSGRISGI